MLGFAEKAFRLSRVDKDGVSMQEKLEQVERTRGKHLSALDLPDPPVIAVHVWDWFQDLSQGRGMSEYGACPLSWLDIYAWSQLTKTILRPWEIHLIRSLDNLWFKTNHAAEA